MNPQPQPVHVDAIFHELDDAIRKAKKLQAELDTERRCRATAEAALVAQGAELARKEQLIMKMKRQAGPEIFQRIIAGRDDARAARDVYRQELGAARQEIRTLRELLWLRHGCQQLYGDDGEQQCGRCAIDFQRDPVTHIAARFVQIGEAKLKDYFGPNATVVTGGAPEDAPHGLGSFNGDLTP